MKFLQSKYLPYVAALLLFAILTLIYFKPLLGDKELRQHDIAMHKGMSQEIEKYRKEHNGDEPLWTNSMFGGMPAYQVSTKYPGNLINKLDFFFKLYLPHPGGYMFLCFLGFFILLLCLGVDPWLALVGGVAYGLSTYFLSIIQAGHNSKANALGYLPALIGGIVLLFRGYYKTGFAVTALFTAMELNANHVQIAYYGYIIIGFLLAGYLVQAVIAKTFRRFVVAFALFAGASLLGMLPNAGNLMTTNEYGKLSNRGKAELTINPDMSSNRNVLSGGLDKDYATNWSYGIGETFSFLIPDFKGGGNASIGAVAPDALKKVDPVMRDMVARSDAYFGDQPSLGAPDYIGAIVVFLAILALFIVRNPVKWPLVAVTVLGIMLGWGHNFMSLTSFFMDHVWGYNKFRAVSMIMVIAEFTLPLLAMLAVQELITRKSWNETVRIGRSWNPPLRKVVFGVAIAVGGFCLLCYVAPDMVNTFHASNEEADMVRQYVQAGYEESDVRPRIQELMPQLELARTHIFRSDAIRSFIFILLGFGVLYLYFIGKINRYLLITMLGVFILVDLWSVDRRYLNDQSFTRKADNQQRIAGMSPADASILEDKDPNYRVLNLSVGPFDDASTSYHHKSVGGYHGAKLRRYVDLIDFHIRPEINILFRDLSKTAANDSAMGILMDKLGVLNMLNTKYFILPTGEKSEELVPLRNPRANGNAWFVSNVIRAESPDSEIVKLKRINTKREAVVNQKFFSELGMKEKYIGDGDIRLVSYEPNYLVYEAESASGGLAVFSEIYYPHGWNAFLDGQPVAHAQVNYVLRGLLLPPGRHKVEFRFEPQTYKTGNTIALIGSILLLLVVIVLLARSARTVLLLVKSEKAQKNR